MARKFNLFNFLDRKLEVAEISGTKLELLNQLAFKELALHIGVSYIANTLSKCEFKVYENGKETKNRLYYLLNVSPNPNQNSSQFINKLVEEYYYHGGALVVPNNNYMYCADSFDIDDTNPLKENIFQNVTFNCHEIKKKHKASEVFYFKLDNREIKGLIDGVYAQYGEILSQALATFKRTNGTRYKLALEQYNAGDMKFKQLYEEVIKKGLDAFVKNDNGVYVQYRGTDLQTFDSANAKDASDIIAMRKETFDVVAQGLKIPLPMMYGDMTNIKDVIAQYLTFCIDPLADMISEEYTRKYYGFEEWRKNSYVKVDTSCINHVDILEVAQSIYNAVGSGVVNIDDMRDRLGWEKLNTPFSTQYFLSKNFVPAEDMLEGEIKEGGE